MRISGFILDKMRVVSKTPVEYFLNLSGAEVFLNPLLGTRIKLKFTGKQLCIGCNSPKVFNQGYCYLCTQKLPQCDFCILSPEKCHFHLGTCRDENFAMNHCNILHVVYLSMTPDLKVGITRKGNEFVRWCDQGADAALGVVEVLDRKTSGEVEVFLKTEFLDKTSWQKMLKGSVHSDTALLLQGREKIQKMLAGSTHVFLNEDVQRFVYPVLQWPQKVVALNPLKDEIDAILVGIKGQYLIFDSGVLNVRKFQGYELEFLS